MTTEPLRAITEQRLTRRGAVRAGGLSAATILSTTTMQRASAQDATPTAGQEAGGMRPLLSDYAMWEAFGVRALMFALDRGADFGECVTTVGRVPHGDVDGWHRE